MSIARDIADDINVGNVGLPIKDSNNADVLAEDINGVVTLTADAAVIEGSSSGDLVRITQTGSGNALVVEDSANPDSTPFVVDSSGNLMLGGAANSWSTLQAVQVDRASISGYVGNSYLSHNLYASSGGSKYIASGGACQIRLVDDIIIFNRASSGTADATLSFSESMRIDNSGNVLIGSNLRLTHIGGYAAFVGNAGTGGIAINVNQPGIVPATTAGEQDNVQDLGRAGIRWNDAYINNGVTIGSDANEKTEITTSELGLDFINKINPVSYKWNGRYRTHYGMVSQEIETLLSDIGKTSMDFAGFIKSPVTDEDGNETGEYRYGLRYTEFISPMIKAIQEQQTIIESKQSQIDALTAKTQEQDLTIASLISRIEALESNTTP